MIQVLLSLHRMEYLVWYVRWRGEKSQSPAVCGPVINGGLLQGLKSMFRGPHFDIFIAVISWRIEIAGWALVADDVSVYVCERDRMGGGLERVKGEKRGRETEQEKKEKPSTNHDSAGCLSLGALIDQGGECKLSPRRGDFPSPKDMSWVSRSGCPKNSSPPQRPTLPPPSGPSPCQFVYFPPWPTVSTSLSLRLRSTAH